DVGRLGEGDGHAPLLQLGVVLEHRERRIGVQASSGTSRLPFVNAATRSPRIPRSLTTLASVSSSAGKPFTGKRKSLATRIPTIVGVAADARPTMRANAQPPRRGSIDSYPVGVYRVSMTEHHGYTPQKDALARRMKRIE